MGRTCSHRLPTLPADVVAVRRVCSDEETERVQSGIKFVGDEEKEKIIEEKSSYKEESSRKGRRERKRGKNAEAGMVRLFINVGKNQRIQAKDIVGAIAGEAGIPGKLVGTVDIYDKYTFVEVPKENAKRVLERMKNIRIKGNKINIEKANTRRK